MAFGGGVVDGTRLLPGLTRRSRAAREVSNRGDERPHIVLISLETRILSLAVL
jgi:hypothetical protein